MGSEGTGSTGKAVRKRKWRFLKDARRSQSPNFEDCFVNCFFVSKGTKRKPRDTSVTKLLKKSERAGPHQFGQKGQLVKRSLDHEFQILNSNSQVPDTKFQNM